MAFPTIQIQDCNEITSKFEQGAYYSPTKESVFALLSPVLNGMRISSSATLKQIQVNKYLRKKENNVFANKNASTGETQSNSTSNRTQSDSILEDISNGIDEEMRECFPCMFRPLVMEDAMAKLFRQMEEYWERLIAYYMNLLKQLNDISDLFDLDAGIASVCALEKYLLDFVCVPDIFRMIAGLMALLANLAAELNSIFDIIMMFIGPLLMPFLTSVVNTIEQYLMLAIKPLDCIIDSLISQLDKLEYAELFNGPDISLDIGPHSDEPVTSELTIKGSQVHQANFTIGAGENASHASLPSGADTKLWSEEIPATDWGVQADLNPFHQYTASEQKEIDKADADIKAIENNYNKTRNPDAKKQMAKELAEARRKKTAAVHSKNNTYVSSATEGLRLAKKQMHDLLNTIIKYIKEIVSVIETLVEDLMGELMKFITAITGANTKASASLGKKLEIIKIIEFLEGLINLIQHKKECSDTPFIPVPPTSPATEVYEDENGNIHIRERDNMISQAIQKSVATLTSSKSNVVSNPEDTTADTVQNLDSLIILTGDLELDAQIMDTIHKIETSNDMVFNCADHVTLGHIGQINK